MYEKSWLLGKFIKGILSILYMKQIDCYGLEDHQVQGKICIKCGTRKTTLDKHGVGYFSQEDQS